MDMAAADDRVVTQGEFIFVFLCFFLFSSFFIIFVESISIHFDSLFA
jgi:hypothetical protein